jgi:hypothetical protein
MEPIFDECRDVVASGIAAVRMTRDWLGGGAKEIELRIAAVPVIIASRMVDDLSCMAMLAERGFEAQVHSLYAGILEGCALISVTTQSVENARAWLQAARDGTRLPETIRKRMDKATDGIWERGQEALQYLASHGVSREKLAPLEAIAQRPIGSIKQSMYSEGYDSACRAKHLDPGYCLTTQLQRSSASTWEILDGPRQAMAPRIRAQFFALMAASRLIVAMSEVVATHPGARADIHALESALKSLLHEECRVKAVLKNLVLDLRYPSLEEP